MLLRRGMALVGAHQADDQEDRADEHMEAVEAGRHEEGRRIVDRAEGERRFGIFIGLDHREDRAQDDRRPQTLLQAFRSEEHTSELQSLMRISYAVFCLKKKKK